MLCYIFACFVKTLNVVFPITALPQIIPFDFGEELVDSGDTTSLTCTIHKGDLPVDIFWLHNNITITNVHGVSLVKGKKYNMLNIDSVAPEHAGNYTCVAKNIAGVVSHSAVLKVNGILLLLY